MNLKRIAWTAVVTSMLAGTSLAGAMAQTTQTSPTTPSTSPAITAPAPSAAAPATTTAPTTRHTHMAAPLTGPVNINTASATDLDKLPGIGKARAAKIIKNRPYKTTDELQSKKVLPEKVYQKIKGQVVT